MGGQPAALKMEKHAYNFELNSLSQDYHWGLEPSELRDVEETTTFRRKEEFTEK